MEKQTDPGMGKNKREGSVAGLPPGYARPCPFSPLPPSPLCSSCMAALLSIHSARPPQSALCLCGRSASPRLAHPAVSLPTALSKALAALTTAPSLRSWPRPYTAYRSTYHREARRILSSLLPEGRPEAQVFLQSSECPRGLSIGGSEHFPTGCMDCEDTLLVAGSQPSPQTVLLY